MLDDWDRKCALPCARDTTVPLPSVQEPRSAACHGNTDRLPPPESCLPIRRRQFSTGEVVSDPVWPLRYPLERDLLSTPSVPCRHPPRRRELPPLASCPDPRDLRRMSGASQRPRLPRSSGLPQSSHLSNPLCQTRMGCPCRSPCS